MAPSREQISFFFVFFFLTLFGFITVLSSVLLTPRGRRGFLPTVPLGAEVGSQ